MRPAGASSAADVASHDSTTTIKLGATRTTIDGSSGTPFRVTKGTITVKPKRRKANAGTVKAGHSLTVCG